MDWTVWWLRESVIKEGAVADKIEPDGVKEVNGAEIDSAGLVLPHEPSFLDAIKDFTVQHRMAFAAGVVLLASVLALSLSPLGGKLMTQITLVVQRLLARPGETLSIVLPDAHGTHAGFIQTIWLLLMSVVMVPLVCRVLPGATPVLGFLVWQCNTLVNVRQGGF